MLSDKSLQELKKMLRVHLNSIGHPIAGDPVYGFKKLPPPPGLERLFLHAYKLEFSLPSSTKASGGGPNGKAMTLETDLPEELQKIKYNSVVSLLNSDF